MKNEYHIVGNRSLLLRCVALMTAISAHSTFAGGLTVITHGWQSMPGHTAWVEQMARAVTNAAGQKGLAASWYHVRIGGSIFSGSGANIEQVSTAVAADTAEVVVTVDWSEISNHATAEPGAFVTISTGDILG